MSKITKNRISALLLVFILSLTLIVPAFAVETAYDEVITLVHTNDVHGAIDDMAYIKAIADSLKSQGEYVLTVDAGDTFKGKLFSSGTNGEGVPPIMNAVGYDVMVPGNNDQMFEVQDKNPAQFIKLIGMLDFPIIAANYPDYSGDGKTSKLFDPYVIFESDNGTKIGVLGFTTPSGDNTAADVEIYEKAERYLKILKEEGCDIVVGLVHLGIGDTYKPSSYDLVKNVEGFDLIVDAHSHTVLPEGNVVGETDTLVVQTGEYLNNIGVAKLYLKDGKIVSKTATFISREEYTAQYTPDATVLKVIEEQYEVLFERNPEYGMKFGSTPYFLDGERNAVRTGETNLGNLITDAAMHAVGSKGVQIASYSGTMIRASIPAGDITGMSLADAFPTNTEIVSVSLSGEAVLAMMEESLANIPAQSPAHKQWGGVTIVFDSSLEGGSRIVGAWLSDGTKIVSDGSYVVLVDGKDRDDMEAAGVEITKYGITYHEAIQAYLATDPVIGETADGRMIDIGNVSADTAFSDVGSAYSWASKEIYVLYKLGVISGTGNGSFSPANNIIRGDTVMMFCNAFGLEADFNENFADVEAGAYYYNAIGIARELGIVDGIGNDFLPKTSITREDAMTMLCRMLEATEISLEKGTAEDISGFRDSTMVSSYAVTSVATLVKAGIIQGSDNALNPKANITRAEMAVMLYKTLLAA